MARPDPHRTAIRQGERDNRDLGKVFDRYLGSAEHPRGQVLTIYRNARRALRDAMGQNDNPAVRTLSASDVLRGFRQEMLRTAQEATAMAVVLGRQSIQGQFAAYQNAGVAGEPAKDDPDANALVTGWMSTVDAQTSSVLSMVAVGADEGQVLGDEIRMGAFQPAPVQRQGATWLVMALRAAWSSWLWGRDRRQRERLPFKRQAIAAIDHLTTDCCLQVHGQIVEMDGFFRLDGTPRYATYQGDVPFHDYCRTSVVLYMDAFDYGLTEEMAEAARAELDARAEAQANIDRIKQALADLGAQPDIRIRQDDTDEIKNLREELRMWRERLRQEVHPSHATSGRNR